MLQFCLYSSVLLLVMSARSIVHESDSLYIYVLVCIIILYAHKSSVLKYILCFVYFVYLQNNIVFVFSYIELLYIIIELS